MASGLLWYDGDKKRPLEEKIKDAARRYREKFGRAPTVCYLHPTTLNSENGKEKRVGRVRLVPRSNILPHHFLIGEEEG